MTRLKRETVKSARFHDSAALLGRPAGREQLKTDQSADLRRSDRAIQAHKPATTSATPSTLRSNGNASDTAVNGGMSITTRSYWDLAYSSTASIARLSTSSPYDSIQTNTPAYQY